MSTPGAVLYTVSVFCQTDGKKRFVDMAGPFPSIYEAEDWANEQRKKKGGYTFTVSILKDPSWVANNLATNLAA